MNHYEELGLDRTADVDEIRARYRELARILHPDRQRQPRARMLAEIQMRRLNGIAGILCDETRRAEYDRTLAARPVQSLETKAPRRVALPANPIAAGVWTGVGLLAAGAVFLFFRGDLSERPLRHPVVYESAALQAQNTARQAARIDLLQAEVSTLRRQLHNLQRSLRRSRAPEAGDEPH